MKTLSLNSTSVSKPVFEEAWTSLLGFYGRAFEAQYGNIDGEQFRLWLDGLNSNSVTDDMVAAATRAVPSEHARKTSYAPNFGDFLRLCMSSKPRALISDDEAFHEAHAAVRAWNRHSWSSAAVYHATVTVGVWWLRQYPEKVTRPKFIEAYHKLRELEMAGKVLAAPPAPEAVPDRQIARTEDPSRAARTAERRGRMAALNKALLELPDAQLKIATGGTFQRMIFSRRAPILVRPLEQCSSNTAATSRLIPMLQ